MCQLHAPWGVKVRCLSTPLGVGMPPLGCSTALTGVLPHTFAVLFRCSSSPLGALSQHYLGVSSTKLFVKNQYIVQILSQNNTIYITANSSFLLQKCVSSILNVTTCDAVKVHPLTAFLRSDPLCNKCYKIEDCSYV